MENLQKEQGIDNKKIKIPEWIKILKVILDRDVQNKIK